MNPASSGSSTPPAPEARIRETLAHAATLARETVPPMHPAGRPFVLGAAAAAMALRKISKPLGTLGFVGAAATAWFFREPRRVAPPRADVAVAPADGTIASIGEAVPPAELNAGATPRPRVSIFLSVFDVHVQRVPAAGQVEAVAYRKGKFLSADLDKASEDNERNSVAIRTNGGHELVVVQIAGLIARRILCEVGTGDKVDTGQTYGLIRFGSRVDLYLPHGSRVLVSEGQRTVGGETALAELPSSLER
ncbi:phosphatidylserine decarboxylase [Haloechinothrix halophila]|uniref:phosphatidylserine decarboxylase n=1 Tax=Haloechinothrix halophila TaxID=1069073 RepID=UPI000A05E644|nr:phosphatidylserine decarboxylase [Haloechinothrix halophila]